MNSFEEKLRAETSFDSEAVTYIKLDFIDTVR